MIPKLAKEIRATQTTKPAMIAGSLENSCHAADLVDTLLDAAVTAMLSFSNTRERGGGGNLHGAGLVGPHVAVNFPVQQFSKPTGALAQFAAPQNGPQAAKQQLCEGAKNNPP